MAGKRKSNGSGTGDSGKKSRSIQDFSARPAENGGFFTEVQQCINLFQEWMWEPQMCDCPVMAAMVVLFQDI